MSAPSPWPLASRCTRPWPGREPLTLRLEGVSPVMMWGQADIYTIGHSTRSLESLIEALQAHGVRNLVDIRRAPSSRHVAHFGRAVLEAALPAAGISYAHMGELGGWRKGSPPDSPNAGWRSAGFRAYADYMLTPEFEVALGRLLVLAREAPTAIMCAELAPRLCHRSLASDALMAKGFVVQHILDAKRSEPHRLTSFARLEAGQVTYPKSS